MRGSASLTLPAPWGRRCRRPGRPAATYAVVLGRRPRHRPPAQRPVVASCCCRSRSSPAGSAAARAAPGRRGRRRRTGWRLVAGRLRGLGRRPGRPGPGSTCSLGRRGTCSGAFGSGYASFCVLATPGPVAARPRPPRPQRRAPARPARRPLAARRGPAPRLVAAAAPRPRGPRRLADRLRPLDDVHRSPPSSSCSTARSAALSRPALLLAAGIVRRRGHRPRLPRRRRARART